MDVGYFNQAPIIYQSGNKNEEAELLKNSAFKVPRKHLIELKLMVQHDKISHLVVQYTKMPGLGIQLTKN